MVPPGADSPTGSLRAAARKSLARKGLRQALRTATTRGLRGRDRRVAAFGNWEALREAARAVRAHVVGNLDHLLARFAARLEESGVRVHWARDAREACHTVLALCAAAGARRVVKSKSMLTEEIGLNACLEAAGLEVTETDLGEFICQLAGTPPSHLTAPALHFTRAEVGRLFAARLGGPPTDEPARLAARAREHLRRELLAADAGITGANFGLVEEGRLVIVENEGNAALTASLPRLHIAVMGMERLLPDRTSLPLFLRLLTASATGQALTAYVSVLGGPRPGAERHIVIVDNGRSRVLADPEGRELLHCIRCGACQTACPVYGQIGGHAYGWVYSGPIGAVLAPYFLGPAGREHPFASSLCGACAEICPVRIDFVRHLVRLRWEAAEARARPRGERLVFQLWSRAAARPQRYRRLVRLLRRLGGCLPRLALSWRRGGRQLPPPDPEGFLP